MSLIPTVSLLSARFDDHLTEVQEGLKNIAAGASPIEIKKGMDIALSFIVEQLKDKSIQIAGSDIKKVASVKRGFE